LLIGFIIREELIKGSQDVVFKEGHSEDGMFSSSLSAAFPFSVGVFVGGLDNGYILIDSTYDQSTEIIQPLF
jgi:hypothetical protein